MCQSFCVNSKPIDPIEKYNLVGKQQWHNLTHSHTLVLQVIGRPSVAHTPERDSKSDSGVDIPKSTPLDISGQQEHLPGGTRAYRLSLKRPLEEFDSPLSPPHERGVKLLHTSFLLWSPVVPSSFLFTDAPFVTLSLDQTRSITPHPRATIKALPASLHPPSPLRIIWFHFARLMPLGRPLWSIHLT